MTNDRMTVLNTIADQGLMSLFSCPDPDVVFEVIEHIYEGGGRVIEFPNRFPQAIRVFSQVAGMVRDRYPDVIFGPGSISDAPTAALFISEGAEFIVSASFEAQTAELCNGRKIPYLPGTTTLTEIANAERAGSEFIKLYPALNPAFVAAVKAPQPWTRIVANGPLTVDNIGPWFEAGVTAVGTMSMAPPALVAEGQVQQVTQRVRALLDRISEVRAAQPVDSGERS